MPDINSVYQSEFLSAGNLKGRSQHAVIEAATVEVLGQGEKATQKVILKLRKCKPRLPLNKTNALRLTSQWGPQTDNWIGKTIELRPEKVMFAGSMVDAIRVYVPAPPTAPAPMYVSAPPKAPVPPAEEEVPSTTGGLAEMANDIPWSEE